MAGAGIPVFRARPALNRGVWLPDGGHNGCGYWIPTGWERKKPDPAAVDKWRPGEALCALMGHGLDLVDLDPRNGGTVDSLNGAMPTTYAVAATPSEGWHGFVRTLGVRSRDKLLPGIDVKAGDADGNGRGFAFIAPTVRQSKTTGKPVAYRWERPPDLDALAAAADDHTGEKLAAMVRAAHGGTGQAGDDLAGPDDLKPRPWDDLASTLAANTRHDAVHKLASALRGRGGWRAGDAIEYMREVVWPKLDQARGGHPYTLDELEQDVRAVFRQYPDGHDAVTVTRRDDETGEEYERRAHHERQVAAKLHELRVVDEARHRLAVERHGNLDPPQLLTLRERLARPRPPTSWRIRGWQPAGSRVVLAAQYKSGKTTLVGNAVRCLVDGDNWLGRHEVTPVTGTVVVLDFEMGADQLDDWLRDQRITADDRVHVEPMRGRAAAFDLLDDRTLAGWADMLRSRRVEYLVLDCLRPVLDALGLDEHRDAGRFLVALDRLLDLAGIPDALVVHHMGHGAERSRGDSRIRDWPDVEWRLVRESDDPASPRYVSAYGRDVDQGEAQLAYVTDTRRLTLAGGTRIEQPGRRALVDVLAALDEVGKPLTGRGVVEALAETEHSRAAIRSALKLGIRTGAIVPTPGPRRSTLHSRPPSAPVRRSAPPVRRRSESECASAPIGRTAHTHAPDNPVSAPTAQTFADLLDGSPVESGPCVACGTTTGRRHLDAWHCPACANAPTEQAS